MAHHAMRHFVRVCTVCQDNIHLQKKKCNFYLEIITCDPSISTMYHPDFIVCSGFMENSTDLKMTTILIDFSLTVKAAVLIYLRNKETQQMKT